MARIPVLLLIALLTPAAASFAQTVSSPPVIVTQGEAVLKRAPGANLSTKPATLRRVG